MNESIKTSNAPIEGAPFLMPIEGVFTISGCGTCVSGTISHGHLSVGDDVEIVTPNGTGRRTTVSYIEYQHRLVSQANEGENISVLLRGIKKRDIKAGYALEDAGQTENGITGLSALHEPQAEIAVAGLTILGRRGEKTRF